MMPEEPSKPAGWTSSIIASTQIPNLNISRCDHQSIVIVQLLKVERASGYFNPINSQLSQVAITS
jgi:hypothetical protein